MFKWIKRILVALVILFAVILELSPTIKAQLMSVHIGKINIPLAPLFFAFLTFIITMEATKLIQLFLQTRLLPKTDLTRGTQATIVSVIGYLGLILAFFLVLSALGINLKNFTIIAGALSVGIGFGLQNIVNNFFSGIIILFGQAIKVGDKVIINGKQGLVRQINIRSTELETADNVRILIPNASILSTDITNLSQQTASTDAVLTLSLPISVDITEAQNLIMNCLKKQKRIAQNPSPTFLLTSLNDSKIQMEVRFNVTSIHDKTQIMSDLRLCILKTMKKGQITLS